jgi:hypothetical protein
MRSDKQILIAMAIPFLFLYFPLACLSELKTLDNGQITGKLPEYSGWVRDIKTESGFTTTTYATWQIFPTWPAYAEEVFSVGKTIASQTATGIMRARIKCVSIKGSVVHLSVTKGNLTNTYSSNNNQIDVVEMQAGDIVLFGSAYEQFAGYTGSKIFIELVSIDFNKSAVRLKIGVQ